MTLMRGWFDLALAAEREGETILGREGRTQICRHILQRSGRPFFDDPRSVAVELGYVPVPAREDKLRPPRVLNYVWDPDTRRRGLVIYVLLARAVLVDHWIMHTDADLALVALGLAVPIDAARCMPRKAILEAQIHAPDWAIAAALAGSSSGTHVRLLGA